MKKFLKRILPVVFLSSIICLSACFGYDPYGDKYPGLNADEIWICDDASIYFRGFDEKIGYTPGFVMTDKGTNKVRIGFLSGGTIDINIRENGIRETLLMGSCSFENDSFTVKEIEQDKLFNFQYETLTFRLYYENDVDWIDGWPVPREGQER